MHTDLLSKRKEGRKEGRKWGEKEGDRREGKESKDEEGVGRKQDNMYFY